ncbi:class I SAM-dependent methyltransferase [Sphingosinicella microcystinivorans]|uniref:class I SAM-dependent methyltransferase n=1 Tax=Sphingosinicella microcystinivorans TaxID=335406 RepID=UPI0022F3CFBD|nr:methyltransferase domain-containing protein [Sphingosinicella microcystinivorans]WBX82884.1 methyltransferase domain-containing protein [Sphingosinicella microcystinivorans]
MADAGDRMEGLAAHDWASEAGKRWLAQLDRFESMIEPIGKALLDQAAYSASETVVDVGCGGGWTTRQIAGAVGNTGFVLGLDISPDLVGTAQERARRAGLANIRFERGDAATAMPKEAPFDRLFSRFGSMFFPEPYPAFANLRRMLRDGGRLDISVWAPIAENPWQREVMAVIKRHIDLPAPLPRAPGPFALGEQDYVIDLLQSAGFSDIKFDAWTGDQRVGGPGSNSESAASFVLDGMQIGDLVRASGSEVHEAIYLSLVQLFDRNRDDDGVCMGAKAWLVSARS